MVLKVMAISSRPSMVITVTFSFKIVKFPDASLIGGWALMNCDNIQIT